MGHTTYLKDVCKRTRPLKFESTLENPNPIAQNSVKSL